MKKTLFKFLGTIIAVVVFFIAQYHIRKYCGIDPRIWFFVVFGISLIGYVAIAVVFSNDNYMKTHSFSEFIEDIIKATEKIRFTTKKIIERIVNNNAYILLTIVMNIAAFTGIMYKLFFHDDFMARTTIYVIYLIMVACVLLDNILNAIAVENTMRKKKIVNVGIWIFIFLVNFLEFVL